ncbi:MAG: hypothetical protein H0V56_01480 [Chthoniobacterales bacterium]|nr:hypothetical protein [Chthoniobacterales bacterium]
MPLVEQPTDGAWRADAGKIFDSHRTCSTVKSRARSELPFASLQVVQQHNLVISLKEEKQERE